METTPWPEQPRGWRCPVVDGSPFIFCRKPRLPSAQATGQLFIHGFPQDVFLELHPGPSSVQACPDQPLPRFQQPGWTAALPPAWRGGVASYTASAPVWQADFRVAESLRLSVWCDALEKEGAGLSLSGEWSPHQSLPPGVQLRAETLCQGGVS